MKAYDKNGKYILDQFVSEFERQINILENTHIADREKISDDGFLTKYSIEPNIISKVILSYAYTDYLFADFIHDSGNYHIKVFNEPDKENLVNIKIGIQNTSALESNEKNYSSIMKDRLISIKDKLKQGTSLMESIENTEYENINNCNIIFNLSNSLTLQEMIEKFMKFSTICLENIGGHRRYLHTCWD